MCCLCNMCCIVRAVYGGFVSGKLMSFLTVFIALQFCCCICGMFTIAFSHEVVQGIWNDYCSSGQYTLNNKTNNIRIDCMCFQYLKDDYFYRSKFSLWVW